MTASSIASFDPPRFSLIPHSHFLLLALRLLEQATQFTDASLLPGLRAWRESVYGPHKCRPVCHSKKLYILL